MVNCVLPLAFPASLTAQLLVFMKGNYISFLSCHVRVFNKGNQPSYDVCTNVTGNFIASYQFSHMVIYNTERKKMCFRLLSFYSSLLRMNIF
jgi:hypothetical protein